MRVHKASIYALSSCLTSLAALFLVMAGSACSLGGGGGVEEPVATLRAGPAVAYPKPLPTLTPIYVEKVDAQAQTSSRLGFRAWDFNDDGRFDMVEVLNDKGELSSRLYDLDFDGVVDFERQITPQSPNPKS